MVLPVLNDGALRNFRGSPQFSLLIGLEKHFSRLGINLSGPNWHWRHTLGAHPHYYKTALGLPRWRSGWEPACQCRGHGFEPWSGKIPHAAEQLSPCTTTTEPAHLEPVLRNERGRDSERPAHRDEEWPPLAATGQSPRTETKTQHSQI